MHRRRSSPVRKSPNSDLDHTHRLCSSPACCSWQEWEWATALVIALLQLRYHACTARWSPLVEARRGATSAALMRRGMEAACDLHLAG